jgi:hypothetical protein
MNGTPLPHEEPQELNPPGGVLAYYWMKTPASGPLKIEVVDARGAVRACVASDTPVHPVDTESINVQAIWEQPMPPPSAAAGMHRVALGAPSGRGGFGGRGAVVAPPKDACAGTPAPSGGRGGRGGGGGLQPGSYSVRLTVDGQTYTQPVTVKADPRGVPQGAN